MQSAQTCQLPAGDTFGGGRTHQVERGAKDGDLILHGRRRRRAERRAVAVKLVEVRRRRVLADGCRFRHCGLLLLLPKGAGGSSARSDAALLFPARP
jgi:hypothetical protein